MQYAWTETSRGYEMTRDEDGRTAVIEAADSLVLRYKPEVGCLRSWDSMRKVGEPDVWRKDNQDEHFLVIIDNLVRSPRKYRGSGLIA